MKESTELDLFFLLSTQLVDLLITDLDNVVFIFSSSDSLLVIVCEYDVMFLGQEPQSNCASLHEPPLLLSNTNSNCFWDGPLQASSLFYFLFNYIVGIVLYSTLLNM